MAAAGSSKPLRLLCIDDEMRILRALKALLRDCEVQLCNDPRQAVAMASCPTARGARSSRGW